MRWLSHQEISKRLERAAEEHRREYNLPVIQPFLADLQEEFISEDEDQQVPSLHLMAATG